MNAVFVCFTGTGNTKRVCEALADALRAQGHDVRLELLRADRPCPDVSDADRLIVAFPVHGFNAPSPVLKFLKMLPVHAGGTAYLVRTSGEPLTLNNGAVRAPVRLLEKKGYRVAGDFHYVMPYNIIFRHSDGMACAFSCPKDAVRTGVLNGWRVNGGYRFDAPPASDEEVCSYCRKSYLRYYHRSEETVEDTD